MHRFRLVGAPQLLVADGVPVRLERRDAALLALLLLGVPSSRERLAGLLWPHVTPDKARNSLRQRLHRMRKASGSAVAQDHDTLQLLPDVVEPLEQALEVLHEWPEARIPDLLEDVPYEAEPELHAWINGRRDRWRQTIREHRAALVDAMQQRGQSSEALRHARCLVDEDPSVESSHLRLVRLLYTQGDVQAAVAACQAASQALADAGGLGVELQRLQGLATESLQDSRRRNTGDELPAGLVRPPRLVGRAAEWQRIDVALARGRIVAVLGEAGIGKSRLLQEVAGSRGWSSPVAARPGDDDLPYALIARCLATWRQRHGEPASDAARELCRWLESASHDRAPQAPMATSWVLGAFERAVADWHRPAESSATSLEAVVLDDLQFADAASLQLLLSLAAGRPARGPAWVVGMRPDELPQALSRWFEQLDAAQVERIVLQPLDEGGVVELLDSLQLPGLEAPRWAKPLRDHVGGRPFDVLDALVELHAQGLRDFSSVPGLQAEATQRREAIARRLARLDEPARALLQVAAVADADFSVELAAAVLGCAPATLGEAWHTLEQAGLFAGAGFAHDIVRQTARAAVPEPVAQAMHRQIAVWLSDAGRAGRVPAPMARIAAHWQAAGDLAQAAPAYAAAAREARDRSAGREELLALDNAARAYRAVGGTEELERAFDCQARRVRLLLLVDSTDLALAAAESLLSDAGTVRQRVLALEARALVRGERVETEASLADAEEALRLAAPPQPARLRLLAAQQAAVALRRLGRPSEGVILLETHRPELADLDDDERLYWLAEVASSLDYADRRREAVDALARVIDEAERLGRWTAAAEAWGHQSIALLYLNRLHDSLHAARRAVDCSRRAGLERGGLLIDEMNLAGSLRDLGEFREYLPLAERLPGALRQAGHDVWALNAENDLAICYAWLGRLDLAQKALTPLEPDTPALLKAARLFTRARLLRLQQVTDHRGAAALLAEAEALVSQGVGRAYVRLKITLEATRDLPVQAALERLDEIEAESVEREQLLLVAHAQVLRLEALLRAGRHHDAVPIAHRVLQRWDREGPTPSLYPPEVWWLVVRALQVDPGSSALTLELLRRARNWILNHALPQLPAAHRAGFLERNVVNAAVLRAAKAADWATAS